MIIVRENISKECLILIYKSFSVVFRPFENFLHLTVRGLKLK
ncbi:hypothetical protein NEISICOT_01902 [Neisseria sicca ATCC 29256]|uniref:Uncharacterized protein n=1 Tax=Neisseria sicca ATCC 29256 TaxID=547045 RepID=C6M5V3_NEISI|nr:hypothetical protein NEISICOT_01902 [Neisseria sicca ATCC 29256]